MLLKDVGVEDKPNVSCAPCATTATKKPSWLPYTWVNGNGRTVHHPHKQN